MKLQITIALLLLVLHVDASVSETEWYGWGGGGPVAEVGGLLWCYRDCEGGVCITGFDDGDDDSWCYVRGVYTKGFHYPSGAITVPSTLGGKSVVRIGSFTFQDCSDITSVTIPSTVTYIDGGAFDGCSNLSSVSGGASNIEISGSAFDGCSKLMSNGVIIYNYRCLVSGDGCSGNYHVPSYCNSISSYAFYENENLRSVTIPDRVTKIGSYAFHGCTNLESIYFEGDMPVDLTDRSFWGIPDGCIIYVKENQSGWNFNIPGYWNGHRVEYSTRRIEFDAGDHARFAHGELRQIVDKGSAAVSPALFIDDDWDFVGWDTDISSVTENVTSHAVCVQHDTSDDLPNGGPYNEIVDGVTWNFRITNGVAAVTGASGYGNGSALVIPRRLGGALVRRIDENAFYHCNISSVTFPTSIKYIGSNAFAGDQYGPNRYCKYGYLAVVNVFAEDLVIAEMAFYGQPISNVRIEGTNITIGASAFASADHLRAFVSKGWGLDIALLGDQIRVGDEAFSGLSFGSSLMSLNVDLSGVVEIGERSFYELGLYYRTSSSSWWERGIVNLKLGAKLGSVGADAFAGACLSTLEIGSRNQIYNKDLLSAIKPFDCYWYDIYVSGEIGRLGEIAFPDTWKEVPANALSCARVGRIIVPESVTNLEAKAFYSCKFMTNVVFKGNAPILGANAFNSVLGDCSIWVYEDSLGWDDDGDGMWNGYRLEYQSTPSPVFPIVHDDAELAVVLLEAEDELLNENIRDIAEYDRFKDWAKHVFASDGLFSAGQQAVKDSPNAWLSFALDSDKLIGTAPTEGDVKIDEFKSAAEPGTFDFEVSIEDIEVGEGATEENIKKVLGVEGSETLDAATFSPENVSVSAAAPHNGKVKFTVGPKNPSAKSMFIRAKMK